MATCVCLSSTIIASKSIKLDKVDQNRWPLAVHGKLFQVGLRDTMWHMVFQTHQKTHQKPQALVMFRDGVSEGQFTTVMARELADIRLACKELQENYEPMITYIVVQKRHHTRFFPLDQNKYKNGNALGLSLQGLVFHVRSTNEGKLIVFVSL